MHNSDPLQLLRARCGEHWLGHFWIEFEAKLTDLFSETATDCKIGIVEVTASLKRDITDDISSKGAIANWVSTRKDLDLLLKV
jgi:hypothetical protein